MLMLEDILEITIVTYILETKCQSWNLSNLSKFTNLVNGRVKIRELETCLLINEVLSTTEYGDSHLKKKI